MQVIKPNPSSQGNSLENLLNLVSIRFFSSNSAVFKDFIEQLPLNAIEQLFEQFFLKDYKTALNMENPCSFQLQHLLYMKQSIRKSSVMSSFKQ